jgi:hypothetical protein
MDSAYVKEHVSQALTEGLTNTILASPVDPIEYLGQFLIQKAKSDAEAKPAAKPATKK